MTFREAADRVMNQHLPDTSAERLGIARVLEALNEASSEIASAFSLGRTQATKNLTSTGSVTLNTDEAAGLYAVRDVTAGGLRLSEMESVRADLYSFVSGPPRYFIWEPTAPTLLTVAPAPVSATTLRLLLLKEMPKGVLEQNNTAISLTPIWNGAYAPFHDLVTLKATSKLLDTQRLWEEASGYMQRYGAREQEFAAHRQGMSKDVAMRLAQASA